MSKNDGKKFEETLKKNSLEQNTFFYRIKDVPQMMLKQGSRVSQNYYDSFAFRNGHLFALELKSTKQKSISFSPKIIKPHQIKYLKEASDYEGVIAGFLLQFRENDNKTYFVHISDFIKYKNTAEGKLENTYINKVNKSSIPIAICEEIGTELINIKLDVNYRYYIRNLLDELIKKYGKEK
ncbi:Holliday junction resolvase RecU [Priestia aryabhattai]|uniref:Holliday junction resolvase RecU n=1 Tax=Priestia aryabhattai TaxID=412384 RepID=UPI003531D540